MMKVDLVDSKRKRLTRKLAKGVQNNDGNVRFLIKESKRRVLTKNDRLVMRPAGKPTTETHCLCDIKSIGYQGRAAIAT